MHDQVFYRRQLPHPPMWGTLLAPIGAGTGAALTLYFLRGTPLIDTAIRCALGGALIGAVTAYTVGLALAHVARRWVVS